MAEGGIGPRVKALREARGWSQRQLAMRAGLKGSHVTMIESGERNPKQDTIQKLAGALGVSFYSLIHPGQEGGTQSSEIIQALQTVMPDKLETEGNSYMYEFVRDLVRLAEQIEDVPGLIRMWSDLNVGDIATIADLISVMYMRSLNNQSGKVTRLVHPHPHPPEARVFRDTTPIVDHPAILGSEDATTGEDQDKPPATSAGLRREA